MNISRLTENDKKENYGKISKLRDSTKWIVGDDKEN